MKVSNHRTAERLAEEAPIIETGNALSDKLVAWFLRITAVVAGFVLLPWYWAMLSSVFLVALVDFSRRRVAFYGNCIVIRQYFKSTTLPYESVRGAEVEETDDGEGNKGFKLAMYLKNGRSIVFPYDPCMTEDLFNLLKYKGVQDFYYPLSSKISFREGRYKMPKIYPRNSDEFIRQQRIEKYITNNEQHT